MKIISKKDATYAIITGLTAGILAWRILLYLDKPNMPWLALVIPLFWVAGVQLGYFLGRWMIFFDQFGKFVAIGFTNFAVDAGVLNLLIAITGIAAGFWYIVYKIISFLIAVTHSYFWNRTWTFQSNQTAGSEFTKFMIVMVLSLLVNVSIAYGVVHYVPHPGTSAEVWANVGAIIGSAVSLIFSFIGFKVIVFKKPDVI